MKWLLPVALCMMLPGCGVTAPPLLSSASLAPMPPGARAFCQLHGGDCDAIPAATAMVEGRTVTAPRGWQAYCARHRALDGCAA